MKEEAKFNRVDSGIKGVEAWKPNRPMQIKIALDMEKAGLLESPLMKEYKALLIEARRLGEIA